MSEGGNGYEHKVALAAGYANNPRKTANSWGIWRARVDAHMDGQRVAETAAQQRIAELEAALREELAAFEATRQAACALFDDDSLSRAQEAAIHKTAERYVAAHLRAKSLLGGAQASQQQASQPIASGQWRQGRRVGRTLYSGDQLIGMMDTPELAARVVQAVNGTTTKPDARAEAPVTHAAEWVTIEATADIDHDRPGQE